MQNQYLSDMPVGLSTYVILLEEANAGVEQQQPAYSAEVDPILKPSSKKSRQLHYRLNGANEEHQKLDEEILLLLCHPLAWLIIDLEVTYLSFDCNHTSSAGPLPRQS
jgi:hypothetical protein